MLNGLAGNRLGHRFVTVVGCGLPIVAFGLAVECFLDLMAGGGHAPLVMPVFTWAAIGDRTLDVAFYFDRLSAVMTLIITGVGSLIHVYSTGYMKDDKSYARYFAYLNLFLFFMLLLVLGRSTAGAVRRLGGRGPGVVPADRLLVRGPREGARRQEGVRHQPDRRRRLPARHVRAVRRARHARHGHDQRGVHGRPDARGSASVVGILLFIGATGKSAQIPLHVWLPDAMAGPTPVSALIHAATMVTAGVYLVARMSGIYMHARVALARRSRSIGAATAFFAATIAVVQTDIKKVLAYSTISQLGFMFLAAGVGAYGVAIFHVYTHAFFKACLFLGAGSVIHALGGEQDMRKMGGLARQASR